MLLAVAGVLLLTFLCTEEMASLVRRWRQFRRDHPQAQVPLDLLVLGLALAAAGLIFLALWLLVGGPGFSYD